MGGCEGLLRRDGVRLKGSLCQRRYVLAAAGVTGLYGMATLDRQLHSRALIGALLGKTPRPPARSC